MCTSGDTKSNFISPFFVDGLRFMALHNKFSLPWRSATTGFTHILIPCHTKTKVCMPWLVYWFLKMLWTYQPLNHMLIHEMPLLLSNQDSSFSSRSQSNTTSFTRSCLTTKIIFSSSNHIWVFVIGTICLVPDTYYYAVLIFTFLYFQTNSKFLRGIALV